MLSKKDIINAIIISEAISIFILPIWLNLNIFLEFWGYRWILFIVAPILSILFLFFSHWLNAKIKFNFWQLAKYLLIGILNTLLDFGILNFLSYITNIYFGWWLGVFNIISFSIAMVNSYFWNKYWAFESRNKITATEFFKFFGVGIVGFLINTIALLGLAEIFRHIFPNMELQVAENISKAIAGSLSAFWSFLGYRYFVFKKK